MSRLSAFSRAGVGASTHWQKCLSAGSIRSFWPAFSVLGAGLGAGVGHGRPSDWAPVRSASSPCAWLTPRSSPATPVARSIRAGLASRFLQLTFVCRGRVLHALAPLIHVFSARRRIPILLHLLSLRRLTGFILLSPRMSGRDDADRSRRGPADPCPSHDLLQHCHSRAKTAPTPTKAHGQTRVRRIT